MAAQSTAEASKKEACFHVESQRIAEGTIPYQPGHSNNTNPNLSIYYLDTLSQPHPTNRITSTRHHLNATVALLVIWFITHHICVVFKEESGTKR
jgi:hypothetical protein